MSIPAPYTLATHQDTAGSFAGIVTLKLEQPGSPMVVLDADLIRAIEAAIKSLPKDMTGFVLASASPRVFIAGADLKSIQSPLTPGSAGLGDQALDAYLAYGQRVFGLICELPVPTVAAINGAALGGGLEIAMHCDALVAAPSATGKPYPVGLPEAGLAICPGWGGTNLLPARMNPADALARTAQGKPMSYDEAVGANLFDRVAPTPESLLETAKQWIVDHRGTLGRRDGSPLRWIGRPDCKARVTGAYVEKRGELSAASAPGAACMLAVEAGLERGWQAALEVERRELTRLRNTDAGRAAIAGFFEKKK